MTWRAYLQDPALGEFTALEEGPRRIIARRGFEQWALAIALEPEAPADSAGRTVGGGRAPHPVLPLPEGGAAVVRGYRRGGMMRHMNRDRYFVGHRAFEELRATERARAGGAVVAEVLAAVEKRRGMAYGALLATRWIEGSVGLDRWIREGTSDRVLAALRQAGGQISRMHRSGISHPDLNLRNLLVREATEGDGPTIYLIDFDRARVSITPAGPAHAARDLKRLARSARKLDVPLGAPEWAALREGYGAGWPLPASSAP